MNKQRDWQADWERCERATPDKWEVVVANNEGPYLIRMPYPKGGTWYGVRMIAWKEDAEFIAEAREALPYWLQRMRELEAESKKYHSNWLKALREATERNVEITLLENELKQLREENRRLKAVAEAAKRKRQLELERREITQKLARKVITKDYWVEHGIKHVKELEKVEAELDAALAELEEEER